MLIAIVGAIIINQKERKENDKVRFRYPNSRRTKSNDSYFKRKM